MATTANFVEYICGQVEGAGALHYKKMFGEYIDGKPILLLCDNNVYVKILPVLDDLMGSADKSAPTRCEGTLHPGY